MIDRLRVKEENRQRLSEAVEMAMKLSEGFVLLVSEGAEEVELTEKYICPDCEISLPEINQALLVQQPLRCLSRLFRTGRTPPLF